MGKKKLQIRPLDDRVLVKQSEAEEKTAGGIVLPDTAKERPQKGSVVAVGPGRRSKDGKLLPMEIEVGDEVYYSKYAGTDIEIDGEKYVILRESDILCVIEKEGK